MPKVKAVFSGLRILGQVALGLLFAWSAYTKFADPFVFAQQIVAYDLQLPYKLIDLLALFIPYTEAGLSLALLSGFYSRYAAGITTLLLTLFTVLVLSAMARGLAIDCGCFGVPQAVGWGKVLENLCLIMMASLLTKWPGYRVFPSTVR